MAAFRSATSSADRASLAGSAARQIAASEHLTPARENKRKVFMLVPEAVAHAPAARCSVAEHAGGTHRRTLRGRAEYLSRQAGSACRLTRWRSSPQPPPPSYPSPASQAPSVGG